jgi:PAS domain S-box-containing protein
MGSNYYCRSGTVQEMNQPSRELEQVQNNPLPDSQSNTKIRFIFISLAIAVIIAGFYILSRFNYPLFHSFADMLTTFIAASVFVVVWNRRRLLDNQYYLYVGISFLFFALFDFMHLLGNKGMGVFPQYGNTGPTFYIVSRYILSISLALAPLFIRRKFNITLIFVIYSAIATLLLLSIFYWRNFPVTYIEGSGLTHFKIISDYVICGILLGATGLLIKNRKAFDPKVLRLIIYSMLLSIATGLAFTLYSDPFGIANAVGHFLQIGSFSLVYLAFIETVLTKPQDILYLDLKQSEERFNTAFRSSPAALAITRINDGTYIDINNSYERLLGYSRQEVVGRKTTDFDIYVYAEQRSELAQLALSGKVRDKELIFRKKDGQLIDTICSLEIISAGNQDLFLSTLIDVTARKKAEESLRHYTSELETANKELESFSYAVSHDLRAPLRSMDGYSAALLEECSDKLDQEGRQWLTNIRASSLHMGQLINDLLGLSRVVRTEMKFEQVNLSELARNQASELNHAQPERKVEFVIAPCVEANGDKNLLELVLQNLMGNAFKFTAKSSSARIEFGLIHENGYQTYFVKDNGAGFDMKYVSKLFQPFQRLHTDKEYQGTGIGLVTVQRIVQRHGGRVWAEGKVDQGATFYFTLKEEK